MNRYLLLILTALLPLLASAHDAEIDGIYYDFSGNNATVTYCQFYHKTETYPGVAAHHAFTVVEASGSYTGVVVVPASVTYEGTTYSVTSIGDEAFLNCTGLTSVAIPNSVTSIGNSAFSGCSGLTSFTIPNSVTSIGNYAFYGCIGLTSITIPNSVTSIGSDALYGCYFTNKSFVNYSSLSSYSNWGATLFDEETSDGLMINNNVIVKCRGWATSVTIPNSVTRIGYGAFRYCSSLTSIKVDTGNTKYDSRNDCNAIIETETNTMIAGCQNTIIPNSVTSIVAAFEGCSGLTSVTIPESVSFIGYRAFEDCSSLTSITIPNSVTSIGNSAFSGCSGLTSITIPNSVTSIDNSAFSGCI